MIAKWIRNQMNQSGPVFILTSRALFHIMYVCTLTMNLEKHSRDLRCSDWPFEKHIQVVDLLVSSAVQQDINQKFSSDYKNFHLILNLNMNRLIQVYRSKDWCLKRCSSKDLFWPLQRKAWVFLKFEMHIKFGFQLQKNLLLNLRVFVTLAWCNLSITA